MKETVLCLVCNQEVGILANGAHLKTHQLTVAEYKLRFPGSPLISEKTQASRRIPFTQAEKEKIRSSCKLVEKTPEWNQKNSISQKGKVIPESSKLLMSKSAKIRMARDGNPMDNPEFRRRSSLGQAEGYRLGKRDGSRSGRGNGTWVITPTGKVWLRSTWEVKVAKIFDEFHLKWLYESERVLVGDHVYVPDFFLPELGVYVEVKGIPSAKFVSLWPVFCETRKAILIDKDVFKTAETYLLSELGKYGFQLKKD